MQTDRTQKILRFYELARLYAPAVAVANGRDDDTEAQEIHKTMLDLLDELSEDDKLRIYRELFVMTIEASLERYERSLLDRRRAGAKLCGLYEVDIVEKATLAAKLIAQRYPDRVPFFNDMCEDTGMPLGWDALMLAAGLNPEPDAFTYDNIEPLVSRDEAIFQLGLAVGRLVKVRDAAKWEDKPSDFVRSV